MILDINQLTNVINITNDPTIIYIGIGSQQKKIELKFNQQLPLFLHNFKMKNIDVKIKLILIDPEITNPPNIVDTKDLFLSDFWYNDNNYKNIYHNEYNVDVYTFANYIKWDDLNKYENDHYDINNLLDELSLICKYNNCLLFVNEFTGKNIIHYESEIKKNNNFTIDKICIDITRGNDFGCFVDLSNPINYPIINYDNRILKYVNFEKSSLSEKTYLLNKYQNIELDIDYENDEIILFYQLRNFNKNIIGLVKNNIISMLRYLYTIKDKNNIRDNIIYTTNIKLIVSRLNLDIRYFNSIFGNFTLLISSDSIDEKNIITLEIITSLKILLKIVLLNTLTNINEDDTDLLCKNMDELDDKYQLIDNFINFSNKYLI
jgi:hypothetical protein